MRCWVSAALAVAVAVGVGQAARAQGNAPSVNTTGELAGLCRLEDRLFCYGFINGAGQFYQSLVNDEDIDVDPFVCPGREVSEDEAVTIFLDWYDAHLEMASEPAIDGLFRAWVAAFPCE